KKEKQKKKLENLMYRYRSPYGLISIFLYFRR
ncbi:MAG: hypothetical protein ACI90V_008389, partial [Bacillariaceae sp.]